MSKARDLADLGTNTGVVVTETSTDTLTNKTISGSSNTLSAIAQSSVTNLTTDLAAKSDLNLTKNTQTASYTLVLADNGKHVEMNVASANNLTVPQNSSVAFPVGSQILVTQLGAGQTTLVADTNVTIRSNGAKLKLVGQYAQATLVKRDTNEWIVSGNLSA